MEAKKTATVAGAARLLGVPRSTLASACEAGHVPTETLACGAAVVQIADAKRWAKTWTPGKRGRKPAKG